AALIGPNGAGKTTFLKTILGQIPPLSGEVLLGASLHVGYFAQAHEGLDPERSLIEEIASVMPHWLPGQIRDYLGKYLFSGDDAYKKVSLLSGGERGRLALAKLALQDTNLLLLDEPTNHLDIPSQGVLQAVLDEYPGTILLVTHDRYLVDALATQIWEINPDESALSVYNGTYSQLREERERQKARLAASQDGAVQPRRVPAPERRAKNEKSKEERRRLAQLQQLENLITSLEQKLAEVSAQLENPPANASEVARLGEEYTRIQREMDEKLSEWERLQTELEAIEGDIVQ
ncbi:MAG: ATP-binding cassette domain-containing protein, partial [Anaerolineae bacterium]